jgi:hypothetical protein
MANLFTREEFGVWVGLPIASDDEFAMMVMATASALVVDAAGAPGWETDPSTAPRTAKLIALRVARRGYLNPDQEISSSVGPISASILRDAAAGMMLTEDELEQLLKVAPGGDPLAGSLWVQRTTRGDEQMLPIIELPAGGPNGGWIPYAYEGETSAFGDPMADGYDPIAFLQLQEQVETLNGLLADLGADKADVSYVNAQLALKAATTALTAGLAGKAAISVTDGLDTRLDAAEGVLATNSDDIDTLTTGLAAKADTTALTAGLAGKASTAALTAGLAGKADQSAVDAALALKASQADLDDLFAEVDTKANAADLGPQIEVDDTEPTSGSGKLWADTTGI